MSSPCSTARCRRNSCPDGRLMPRSSSNISSLARCSAGPVLPPWDLNGSTARVDLGGHQRITSFLGHQRPMGTHGIVANVELSSDTRGRAEDSHIISSRLPPFSESGETVPAAPIAAGSGTAIRTWLYGSRTKSANRRAMNDGPLSVTRNGRFASGPPIRSASSRASLRAYMTCVSAVAERRDDRPEGNVSSSRSP